MQHRQLHKRSLARIYHHTVAVTCLLRHIQHPVGLGHIEIRLIKMSSLRIFVYVRLQCDQGFLIILGEEHLLGRIEDHAFLLIVALDPALADGINIDKVLLRVVLCLVNGLYGKQGVVRIFRKRHFFHNRLVIAQSLVEHGLVSCKSTHLYICLCHKCAVLDGLQHLVEAAVCILVIFLEHI